MPSRHGGDAGRAQAAENYAPYRAPTRPTSGDCRPVDLST